MAAVKHSTRPPTERQMRFAELFLQYGDATQAYTEAYPTVKSRIVASSNAYNLRQKPSIKEYIDTKLAEMREQRVAAAQEVLEYLTAVMRGEYKEPTPLLVGDGIQTLVDKGVGAKERIKAAELLGKRYGMFTDKTELTGAIPVIISGEDELKD